MNKRTSLRVLAVMMLIGSAITWYFMYQEWSCYGSSMRWIKYEIGIGGIIDTLLFVVLFVIQTMTCVAILSKKDKPNLPEVVCKRSHIMFVLNVIFFIMSASVGASNAGPEGSGSVGFGTTITLPALAGVIVKAFFWAFAALYYRKMSRMNKVG